MPGYEFRLPSYPSTAFPSLTTAHAGMIARASDGTRGLHMFQGTDWFSLSGAVVNVKEFGAKGDGVTDDTAAIQAAIDVIAALSAGGSLFFPAGIYMVSDAQVICKSKANLLGAGRDQSIIKALSASQQHVVNAEASSPTDFFIANLMIDGGGLAITSCLIFGLSATRAVVRNCVLQNSLGHSVLIQGSATEISVLSNNFRPANTSAVRINYLSRTVSKNIIRGNRIGQTSDFGISLILADENDISNNYIRGTDVGSNNEPINLDRSSRNRVVGNYCGHRNDSGIVLHTSGSTTEKSAHNVVSANICEENQNWGISITESSEFNVITSNICKNNSRVPVVGQECEIKLDSGVAGAKPRFNIVSDNVCYSDVVGRATIGIQLVLADCEDNYIGLNVTGGGQITQPVKDGGTRTRNFDTGRNPRISADRGDANVTLTIGTNEGVQRFATELTANRTVTLASTNAINGSHFRVVRTGLGAFTLDVGGVKTIPSATAAFVDVEHDGTAWRLTGYGTL